MILNEILYNYCIIEYFEISYIKFQLKIFFLNDIEILHTYMIQYLCYIHYILYYTEIQK